jgi:hypothetical protein
MCHFSKFACNVKGCHTAVGSEKEKEEEDCKFGKGASGLLN